MKSACLIPAPRCGYAGPGVEGHHVLGRDAAGAYVKPEIILPLCDRWDGCHQAGIHRLLRAQGLDGPMAPTLGVLLGRIAVTLGYVGLARTGSVLVPSAFLADTADVLAPIGYALRQLEHRP